MKFVIIIKYVVIVGVFVIVLNVIVGVLVIVYLELNDFFV